MRCKHCNYALWSITTRKCPECGTPFRPSEFEFVPNSVRFACPHCDQAYYGTAANGHLIPESFDCVKCEQPIHMDEMVLLPTEGVEERRTVPQEMPWLERGKLYGFFKAWMKTVGMAMVAPGRLMHVTPAKKGVFSAMKFFVVCQFAFAIVSGSPLLVMFVAIAGGLKGIGPNLFASGGVIVGLIMLVPVLVFVSVTPTAHLIIMVTGKRAGGFSRTLQAVAYSSGANVLNATPCVGMYQLGLLWWLVSAILMVREGQRVSGLRAIVAVLAVPALCLTGICVFVGVLASQSLHTSGSGPTTSTWSVSGSGVAEKITPSGILGEQLLAHARKNGELAPHVAQALAYGSMSADAFWQVPGVTSELSGADPRVVQLAKGDDSAWQLADLLASELPKDTIAYRLGDVVFTYPGITMEEDEDDTLQLAGGGDDLWLAVTCPPEGAAPMPGDFFTAHLAKRSFVVTASSLASELQKQNQLRKDAHLPPLPDLRPVRFSTPAVGPAGWRAATVRPGGESTNDLNRP